ncbi:MAG: PIN domain-containing protein [Gemmatimonadales bacterium]|nr:PIN domain-containing protein [Gemmatimonadales bacterium]
MSAALAPLQTAVTSAPAATATCSIAEPTAPSTLAIRDPDDAWVLASALTGGAQLLVTGDQDLLAVSSQAPIPILTPRAACEHLRGPV